MKTSTQLISLMILLIFASASCSDDVDGKGPNVTEELSLSDFQSVDLRAAAEVTILQGPVQEVLVTGQANIIQRINREVNNGHWSIDLGNDNVSYDKLEIVITLPTVRAVALSGSGSVNVEDFQEIGDLDLSLSGSGSISLGNIDGPDAVEVAIGGSGSITAIGMFSELSQLDVVISGSGSFNGFSIPTMDCDALISGSGNIEVSVMETLNVEITGSGSVYYKDSPRVSANISGSGQVIDAN